jgi:hypothetical protein
MDQRVQINKVIELDGKTVEFTGRLEGRELDVVIEVGLNILMNAGALPIIYTDDGKATPDRDAMN